MCPCRNGAVVMVLALLAATDDARAGTREISHGSLAVQAASAQWIKWELPAEFVATGASSFRIMGTLKASGGSGNDVEVAVFSETEFLNWRNGHTARALYSSGRVTAADVDAPLPGAGTYYVVLDNQFSAITPKTVEGTLTVRWTDPPPPESSPAADAPALAVLVFLLAIAGVGGAVIALVVRGRRTTVTK